MAWSACRMVRSSPFSRLLANFNVAGAIPVAGNFDYNAANGDEIGLYNQGKWGL